ncbi:MAG TPA: cytochrome c [Terriglobales bacterium]|nr:cytochrome c [Terriglobales bacterium]
MYRKTAIILLITLGAAVMAQEAAKPQVKKVPAEYTSASSGEEMYQTYCASCHGKDGRGQGPAAPALKSTPTDLTLLAKKNGGKFPRDHFSAVLTGKAAVTAHGSQEMPVWGKIFWKMSEGHQSEVQQRVFNLSSYVQSLQQK